VSIDGQLQELLQEVRASPAQDTLVRLIRVAQRAGKVVVMHEESSGVELFTLQTITEMKPTTYQPIKSVYDGEVPPKGTLYFGTAGPEHTNDDGAFWTMAELLRFKMPISVRDA